MTASLLTTDDGGTYELICTGGRQYTCDFSNCLSKVFLTTTVSDNLADYSRREVKAAAQAQKVSRMLRYASPDESQE